MPSTQDYLQHAIPHFTINKIFVESKKVNLQCSMRRSAAFDFSSWNGIGSINLIKYLDLHVVAVKGEQPELERNLFYAQGRVSFLSKTTRRITDWEDTLKSERYAINGHTKTNILQILQGDYLGSDPLTATEIPHNLATNTNAGHNISFQISIDCVNEINNTMPGLDLFAFFQLDIKSLSEEFGLQNFIGSLTKIGGPLVYEKALVRKDNSLVVPTTRKVFVLPSGNFYSGPAHHHSPARDGGDYAGWMTGPPTGDMTGRQRLNMREVQNTKVSSNIFIEKSINFEYDGYSSGSGFFGSKNRFAAPYGNLTIGPELLESILSDSGITLLAKPGTHFARISNLDNRMLRHLSIVSEKNQNPNLFDNSIPPEDLFSIVPPLHAGPGHYLSIFLLNFEQLVRTNSKFGYLIDFHREELSPSALESHRIQSRDFINNALQNSVIWQMKVFRKRITNSPIGNNKLTTNEFENYDNDQIEKFITSLNIASHYTGDQQVNQSGNLATIEIIDDLIETPSGFTKTFELKDYDLFHNYSFGKYQYDIEIELEDGIRLYLIKLHRAFEQYIAKFSKLVTEASQPYLDPSHSRHFIGKQFLEIEQEVQSTGNYNFHISDFTAEYKRSTYPGGLNDNFLQTVRTLTDLYTKIIYVLTKKSYQGPQVIEQLIRSLMPATGSLDNMSFFLDICSRLQDRFRGMIYDHGPDQNTTGVFGETDQFGQLDLNLGSKRKHVGKNLEYPDRYIRVRSKTNSRVDASSKFKVLFTANNPAPSALPGALSLPAGTTVSLPDEFFVLAARPSLISGSQITSNRTIPPLTFDRLMIASSNPSGNTKNRYLSSARIRSAIETVETKRGVQTSSPSEACASLEEFDSLLYSSSGATFGSLLSKVTNTTQAQDVETKLKGEILESKLQASIFNSIITAEDGTQFKNQMEEKYKDMFVTKKAAGALYDTIMFNISTKKLNDRARNKTTFQQRIENCMAGQQAKAKNVSKFNSNTVFEDTVVTSHRLDASNGLSETSERRKTSTSIIIKKVVKNSADGAQLVNSIVIDRRAPVTTRNHSKNTRQPAGSTTSESQVISRTY